ncbi:sugar kinase [Colwellia sp. 75C3]|uniref:ROK family protein n=1 Tax=Colwellia sp. 75C3 TaxID=888425 RepID=UPI000C349179|nr:ROK family protein [Colwellia sp. 75C3]PKG85227.1 sugar kinase [Colwellia sp. 75C3]
MKQSSIVVIDLGGTKINVGLYRNGCIEKSFIQLFDASQGVQDSLLFIKACIEQVLAEDTIAIAIGVPGIVDVKTGIVFGAVNIASWSQVSLKQDLQALLSLPVYVNNDVNCFVKGEHLKLRGEGIEDMVGLCLGTGLGSGLVLQNNLHTGVNGCAGEIGSFEYRKGVLEDYCSGKFFTEHYQECGAVLAEKSRAGDELALDAFRQFGLHLSVAVKHLLMIIDPQLIVIGGSVANSYDLFIESVWKNLADFPYQNMVSKLTIEKSRDEHSALLGAAHLYLESLRDC